MNSDNLGFRQWVRRFEALPTSTQSAVAETLLNQSLELYVNSTEQCNFRCKYCYEDFSKGRMPRHIVESVNQFIVKRSAGCRRLYLNWFGGEPLVATDVVLDISRHAKAVCESRGITLCGSVTTNGWNLSVGKMSDLLSAGITSYQITLDGDRESHDTMRVRADGQGTFETIWSNLMDLHESDLSFSILLRIHVRPSNIDSVRSLLYSAQEKLGADKRFVLGLHPLLDLGGPTGGSFETLSNEESSVLCDALKQEFGDVLTVYGDGASIGNSAKEEGCGLAVCYACKSNAFLIRSDGSVGKCTVALDKEFNSVGFLEADGEIHLNQPRFKKWTSALYTLDPAHLACPAKQGPAFFRENTLVQIGTTA